MHGSGGGELAKRAQWGHRYTTRSETFDLEPRAELLTRDGACKD